MYQKFDQLVKARGITVYRVARDLGFAQSMFTDWKNGRSSPKANKLKKIADYFGVTIEYFLEQ